MERPTWSNYGTHDESARPRLWNGCLFAVAPCLGPTGGQLIDVVRGVRGTMSNMDAATDWIVSGGQYCVDFDGTNDRVSFGTWKTPINDGTISLWVNNRGSTFGYWIDTGYDVGFWLGIDSATVVKGGFVASGAPYGSTVTFTPNIWNHVAVRRIGTTSRVFLNGSSLGTTDYTNSSAATGVANSLILGSSITSSQYTNCQLDDVRIYNRPLSDAEIRELAEFRGAAYERRSNRRYVYQTDASIPVTGTVAVTLDNLTAAGSGTSGTGGGTGLTASQPLAFNLSDSLVIGG